jgi:hypothetical protein
MVVAVVVAVVELTQLDENSLQYAAGDPDPVLLAL